MNVGFHFLLSVGLFVQLGNIVKIARFYKLAGIVDRMLRRFSSRHSATKQETRKKKEGGRKCSTETA
jgi:hypothetical protein